MIGLDEEMVYRVTPTNPLEPTAGSPRAIIQSWQVSEVELVGQRISAKLAATGVDFISVGQLTHSARAIDFSLELLDA